MNLNNLNEVIFYLDHCRKNGNPTDHMAECLMVVANELFEMKQKQITENFHREFKEKSQALELSEKKEKEPLKKKKL